MNTIDLLEDRALAWGFMVILALSVISFALYGLDKRAAIKGRRRVPEARLLWWDFLGGWPGGALAQTLFRHKTRKTSYRVKFVLVVLLNLAVSLSLLWASGSIQYLTPMF